ncbi:ArsI/CadI family heavy metal resistance metalloenzyme [Hyphococcus lacteus]|uniref:ArsI/CadI family heavy metal resistance metalloenzyme n=1 Tax=Hyphococcus lacteus TaxID=3143536 RepID=A0ABV3Z651_9PROT
MKRLHIHLKVEDLEQSIMYYNALFGTEPARREADYAKWMLDEPSANIAISSRSEKTGVDHVGISLDNQEQLESTANRLRAIEAPLSAENDTTCCYANSDKYWSHDPQGAIWELFHTFGSSDVFGKDPELVADENANQASAPCCAPQTTTPTQSSP